MIALQIQNFVDNIYLSEKSFFCLDKKDDIPAKVLNESKRSSIAEHLVINPTCDNSYNINGFKIIKTCSNIFDLIKLEAICSF